MIDVGIDSKGSSLRLLIAQALGEHPTFALLPYLEDRSFVVRTAAAREIQVRGGEESFEYLMRLLGDKRAYVREIAVFALGQYGTPTYPFKSKSIESIVGRLVHDTSSSVRAAAAAALGHLKAYEALEAITAAVGDNSIDVRACVGFALAQMKRSKKARDALRILKDDESEEVRYWSL